jgi:hypothetical protein
MRPLRKIVEVDVDIDDLDKDEIDELIQEEMVAKDAEIERLTRLSIELDKNDKEQCIRIKVLEKALELASNPRDDWGGCEGGSSMAERVAYWKEKSAVELKGGGE